MSRQAIEVFNDTNPTPTSNAKVTLSKSFVIARTDTTISLKAVIPTQAFIINAITSNLSAVASNAATTAVVNFYAGNTSTLISTTDVKTAAAPGGASALIALNTAAALAPNSDLPIYANYAETGTASSTGGPWLLTIEYVT